MLELNFDEVSQASHVFLGALIVMACVAKGLYHPQLIGSLIAIVWAALKEFYFDHFYEDPVTRGSDLEDFIYYCVGVLAANVFLWI